MWYLIIIASCVVLAIPTMYGMTAFTVDHLDYDIV